MSDVTQRQDDDLVRIQLTPALPCGIPGCRNLATTGLVEHDPQTAGLWHLLPLCDACARGSKPQGLSGQLPDHLTA